MASGFSDAWMKDADSTAAAAATGRRSRRSKGPYEDIVDERRQRGELGWVLRSRQSVPRPLFGASAAAANAATGPVKSPAAMKLEVLGSDRLLYGLREISQETGQPVPDLLREAGDILDEMAHNLSMFAVRSFGFAVAKAMKRLYRGVYVNREGIAQLRKACSEYPVILMPMHRSYADFLLLSLICFDYDLPLPAIASAMDFMGMKFIGSILRHCGAFFIRRSFSTDRVYWLTFVEYVKTHVRDGLHPVEFFIEGTRSRTGKSLSPKTGMLGAILESWFMCEVPDVRLVPVSISYDRILEERLYAYELLGVPKPRESTSGLLKARALLSEDFGNVHFYFGEPISLRQFAETHGGVDRAVHSLAPKVKAQLTEAESNMLKAAAHHVIVRHGVNAIVPPFCLLAALLLANGRRPTQLRRLSADADWLRRLLTGVVGASVDWTTLAEDDEQAGAADVLLVRDQCRMHADLVRLSTTATTDGDAVVSEVPPDDATPEAEAAIGLRLAAYRNHLMCHLASVGLLASVTAQQHRRETHETLRRLFHREFPVASDFEEASRLEQQLLLRDDAGRGATFVRQLVRPFLIGYWGLCDTLLTQPALMAGSAEPDRVIAKAAQARAFARMAAQERHERCCDSVSLDLLSNAVHGLRRLNVIAKAGRGMAGGGACDWPALRRLTHLLESLIEPLTTEESDATQRSKL